MEEKMMKLMADIVMDITQTRVATFIKEEPRLVVKYVDTFDKLDDAFTTLLKAVSLYVVTYAREVPDLMDRADADKHLFEFIKEHIQARTEV